jgi:WD40 repeat protein
LISASSDSSVCLWDIRFPNKIVHNWNQYQGSVTSLIPTDNFHNFYSTDSSGNIFLTNITTNNFCQIDFLNDRINCAAYEDNKLLVSTASNLYQYVRFYSS